MQFNLSLLVGLFPLAAMAAINGRCSGTATGAYKENGICVSTSSCASYGGTYISGGCPSDASNIKCCLIDQCYGDESRCQWTNNYCDGPFRSGWSSPFLVSVVPVCMGEDFG